MELKSSPARRYIPGSGSCVCSLFIAGHQCRLKVFSCLSFWHVWVQPEQSKPETAATPTTPVTPITATPLPISSSSPVKPKVRQLIPWSMSKIGIISDSKIVTFMYLHKGQKSRIGMDLCFRTHVVKRAQILEYRQCNEPDVLCTIFWVEAYSCFLVSKSNSLHIMI